MRALNTPNLILTIWIPLPSEHSNDELYRKLVVVITWTTIKGFKVKQDMMHVGYSETESKYCSLQKHVQQRNNSTLRIINLTGDWYDQVMCIIYCFKDLYWFSIILKIFIGFSPKLPPGNCSRYWRVFFIWYCRYKQDLSNVSKYVFTGGFFSVESKYIYKLVQSWGYLA